jgi:hypothetical protein
LYAGFYVRQVLQNPEKASCAYVKRSDITPDIDPDNPEISVAAVYNEKWRKKSIEQVILKLGSSVFEYEQEKHSDGG